VSGGHRLEEDEGFGAPDLADDDVVGPVPEREPDQVVQGYLADFGGAEPVAFPACELDPVLVG